MSASPTIGFIGFGNMASAMAKGLVNEAGFPGDRIYACAECVEDVRAVGDPIGVNACETALDVAEASDIVIIAVKPHQVESAIAPAIDALASKVVVSVAAGLLFDWYEERLKPGTHHMSTIPNTPIAVGAGVIACEAENSLTEEEFETFRSLFAPIALIEEVPGRLLATASSIAGCGPAFAAMFIESLADGAVKHGMPRATAYRLAAQMVRGTGALYLATGNHPGAMKDAVCSPGGTTIRGVAALEQNGFRGAVISAIDAVH